MNLCYGFGLDVECKEYKFVVVSPDNDKGVSCVFIYSLKTGSWIKIDIDLKPISLKFDLGGQKFHATYVNGACHWIRIDVQRRQEIVLSFNLSGQCFRYIDLPPKSPPCGYGDDYDNSFTMSVWKDMLSVSETTKEGTMFALNIWVIKDYSNLNSCCWTLIKKVHIKEHYWGKNMLRNAYYKPWGITEKKYFMLGTTTPFIDSLSDHEAEEIQKYLAASLQDLVPFQESLVLP
ncbi:F-box/kelch-repeat protein At3g06240-like [Silene latifolia]|uniref:F-box/kelch-repeat protein At3g06240-like n=1 Tax=Silene latifolia TaxID=37657 RepID=UPI003D76C03D